MSRHNISNADELFWGDAYDPQANGSKRGIPTHLPMQVDLGAPVAASANAISLSQSVTGGVAALLNGALGATLDVPRNVVAAWTNTAVCTVTGTDKYGRTLVESSASGTSMTGKKAFKTITSVVFSASVTGATVGTGDVLGLPYRLAGKYDILAAYADNTADLASATVVAGDATTPTATTGDVRGTIDFNTACNGSVRFRVWMKPYGAKNRAEAFGVDQYAG